MKYPNPSDNPQGNPHNIEEALKAVRGERMYQLALWQDVPTHGIHQGPDGILAYLVFIREYLNHAMTEGSCKAVQRTPVISGVASPGADEVILHDLRKIAALAVAAMEQNGVRQRDMDGLVHALNPTHQPKRPMPNVKYFELNSMCPPVHSSQVGIDETTGDEILPWPDTLCTCSHRFDQHGNPGTTCCYLEPGEQIPCECSRFVVDFTNADEFTHSDVDGKMHEPLCHIFNDVASAACDCNRGIAGE